MKHLIQTLIFTVAFIIIIVMLGLISKKEGLSQKEGFKAKDPLKQMSKLTKGFAKILGFFTYLGKFFKWLGDIVECSFETIINLPDCILFYLVDLVIGFFAMLIKLICGFFGPLEKARLTIWKMMKWLDGFIHKYSGYHVISWPDSILKRCYKCRNAKMPKMKL